MYMTFEINDEDEKDDSKEDGLREKINLSGILSPLILALIVYLVLGNHFLSPFPPGSGLSNLVFPAVVGLLLSAVPGILGSFFVGPYIPTVKSAVLRLSLGVFLFLLLTGPTASIGLEAVGYSAFYLFILASGYELLSYPVRDSPIFSAVLMSGALIIGGFILRMFFHSLIPETMISSLVEGETTNTIFLYGIRELLPVAVIFGGIATIFTPLSLSQNNYLKVLGDWFESHKFLVSVVGGMTWMYVIFLRPDLVQIAGGWLIVAEWGVVGVLSLAAYLGFESSIGKMSEPISFSDWAKHRQRDEVLTDTSQEYLTGLIRDFTEKGKKTGILVYLVDLAREKGFSDERIQNVLNDLVEYESDGLPSVATKWELERIRKQIRQERREVLKDTIDEIEERG